MHGNRIRTRIHLCCASVVVVGGGSCFSVVAQLMQPTIASSQLAQPLTDEPQTRMRNVRARTKMGMGVNFWGRVIIENPW